MNDKDFKAFLAAMERFTAKHTATPEAARKVLQREGVLTADGEIAWPYAPLPASEQR
jgi:hypothetical protein